MYRIRIISTLFAFVMVLAAFSASIEASNASAASLGNQTIAQSSIRLGCGIGCWHTKIETTYEEGGAPAGVDDGGQTNATSAWYSNWTNHLCTVDRDGTRALVKKGCDNLFYFALPCGDFNDNGPLQADIKLSPWAHTHPASGQSWFKNKWIEVSTTHATIYAQWADVGPMGNLGREQSDCPYVFQGRRPTQEADHHANSALDLSPRAFKLLTGGDLAVGNIETRWRFVRQPPAGPIAQNPWLANVTTAGPDWK